MGAFGRSGIDGGKMKGFGLVLVSTNEFFDGEGDEDE